MIKIDQNLTDIIVTKASNSERRRANYNFHKDLSDTLHRMLNVLNTDTYVCPHKHINPDKREAFILITGKLIVLEFDDNGDISDYTILDREKKSYGCEIGLRNWHSIICLEENTIIYEIKEGPYDEATDKVFAPWAPREGDADCLDYNKSLIDKILKQ